MKILGIGNAIVDVICKVNEDFLSKNNLTKGTMKFVEWKLTAPLKVNNYGFLEPSNGKKVNNPDLILVPLLAYDSFHNRLGYGKGYYDRFLNSPKNKNILKVGVAFSHQKYKKLPNSKLDVKLDYILTEKGLA